MRPLTLILPYYRNPQMLQVQACVWAEYPAAVRAALDVIVVDDCSPKDPAMYVLRPFVEKNTGWRGPRSVRVFRALKDVRWNWLFCRNLGVDQATTEWVLMTDIDHVVPGETLHAVMTADLDPALAYRFARRAAPAMTVTKSHPNSWLMTRALFDAVGGYDERLSGFYGTDSDFRERVSVHARGIQVRTEPLIRYENTTVPDAETTAYTRKDPRLDGQLETAKAARRQERRQPWRPKRLTIPWDLQLSVQSEGWVL